MLTNIYFTSYLKMFLTVSDTFLKITTTFSLFWWFSYLRYFKKYSFQTKRHPTEDICENTSKPLNFLANVIKIKFKLEKSPENC